VLNGNSKYAEDIRALGREITGLKATKKGRLSALGAPLGKLFGRGKTEEASKS
jgi:hypothetical protein